jgi:hypothetical protein
VKAGSIRAAIWENDGREGVFYTFTLERLYKAADGWKSTDSFSHRDAANLSAAAAMASAWIAERVAEQAAATPAETSTNGQRAAA